MATRPKTGGRQKGSITKRTQRAFQMMKENDYDPLVELIKEAKDPETTKATKIEIHHKLMPFVYPKLSSVELSENEINRRPAGLLEKLINDTEGSDGE